jgi:hypothetical protein
MDPGLAVSLQAGDEAAVAFAAIPVTAELRAADEAIVRSSRTKGVDGADRVRERIEQMASNMRGEQRQPDLSNASMAELLVL